MSTIRENIESQKFRVSMNQKHLCLQSGDTQLVMVNGQYRELPIKDITLHREGEHNESPWTRWYDMKNPDDREAIELLREIVSKNPNLEHDINFRIRIVGEYDSGEPWPGYDDQDSEQIIAYYKAQPPKVRQPLEKLMQYELNRVGTDEDGQEISLTDNAKLVAIESLNQKQATQAKDNASAGVKM